MRPRLQPWYYCPSGEKVRWTVPLSVPMSKFFMTKFPICPLNFNLSQHQDICRAGFRLSVQSTLANRNQYDNCSVHVSKAKYVFLWGLLLFNKNNRNIFSFKPLTGIPCHIIKEVRLVLCSHTKVLTTLQVSSFSRDWCNNHWHSRTSAGYKFKMGKLSIWTSSEARKLCQFNLF